MAEHCTELIDPRILRTRQSLQQALGRLLETTDFVKISVQEIAEAAMVNRATFYDHYPDKFALLECMVGSRFWELLRKRGIRFEGGCPSALKGMVLGVCDYLADAPGMVCERQVKMEPHMESAVTSVLRRSVLEGLQAHPPGGTVPLEVVAAAMSWAIYGAVKEWLRTPERCSSEEIVEVVVGLVGGMMSGAPQPAEVVSVR